MMAAFLLEDEMRHLLIDMPVWALALAIFLLRIVDVTIGTLRTLSIVEGRIKLSVALGFFEVFIWIMVISQVVARLGESPLLAVFYAAGFAAGNATGILLEKRLALGSVVLRIITQEGEKMAAELRAAGQVVTIFPGQGRDGAVDLLYISCEKKRLQGLLDLAARLDPSMFFVVERANAWGHGRDVVAYPGGWRSFWKKT